MYKMALIFCLLFLMIISACKDSSSPKEYYDQILEKQNTLADVIFDINRYLEHADTVGLMQVYNHSLEYAKNSYAEIEKLGAYDQDTVLLNATLSLLMVYREVLENEIWEMITIVKKPGEISDADDARILRLRRNIYKKLTQAEREFAKADNYFRNFYLGTYLSTEPDTTLFEELNDSVPSIP
ncbi:MAG TPA: hypothetical protein DCX03_07015 [Bacteroidales bacterium]|nr:hypothetical protein [Bacteroidales bacterium]